MMLTAESTTSRCVYCLQDKPLSDFNIEHVVPRMMGTYDNALTLAEHQVCKECNTYFSRELENFASLDSYEGLLRVQLLAQPIGDNHEIGKKRITFVGQNGLLKGLRFRSFSDKQIQGRIQFQIDPVIGIIKDEQKQEYDYYSTDSLPIFDDEIRDRMTASKVPIVFIGMDKTVVESSLKSKGLILTSAKCTEGLSIQDITAQSEMQLNINIQVDNVLLRLAAKTLLNFICYSYGKEIALSPALNSIRRFVRYNELDEKLNSFISQGGIIGIPENVPYSHIVDTFWSTLDRIYLCGAVSWFGAITYTFALVPCLTSRLNIMQPTKYLICDNKNRVQTQSENILVADWPNSKVKIQVLDNLAQTGGDNNA